MAGDASSPPVAAVDLAEVAAGRARSHPDVVDLDTGLAGEFATYGAGRRVTGVRVDPGRERGRAEVRIRLVVRYGRPLPVIGDEVRDQVLAGLEELGCQASLQVHVADIVEPVEAAAEPGRVGR
jgi:uncharacterized alkaline shock family protein YloU